MCFNPVQKKINVAVSELDLTVQNSVIVNKAMVKVTCTWIIMKLRMKIMILKVAQKMNNLLKMLSLLVVLV